METTALRPGYAISRVIKGGWQLAGGHGDVDKQRAIQDMRAFLDAGITTFDCADIYTGVEALIGEFIAANAAECRAANLKVHTKLVPDLDRLNDCTPAELEATIDRSLMRLRVERLDLVQFFWWDLSLGAPVETLATLAKLQQHGKIDRLGITNWDVAGIAPFVDAGLDIVSAQVQYSVLDARPKEGLDTWCATHGIALIGYGVLAGGFLTQRWLGVPDPGFDFTNRSLVKYRLIIDEFGGWDLFQALLRALNEVGARHDVDIATVAARYALEQPQVAAIIVGARYAEHLPAISAIAHLRLAPEDTATIDAILETRQGPAGPVYGLEGDRDSRHGAIMKYNLGR